MKSAEVAVKYISILANKIKMPVFVLIDEYDNFANELITGGKQSTYESILQYAEKKGSKGFPNGEKLKNIEIREGVQHIGVMAFQGNVLTSVSIP